MNKLIGELLLGVIYLFSFLPLRLLYLITRLIGWIAFSLFKYRSNVVSINIAGSFPLMDYSEIDRVAKRFYKNLTEIVAESIKALSFSKKGFEDVAIIENPEIVKEYYEREESLMIITGHLGNWELLSFIEKFKNGDLIGYKGDEVVFGYKKVSSNVVDHMVKRRRSFRSDIKLVESNSLARAILRGKDKRSLFFLLADQYPAGGSRFNVNFLNRECGMMNGPEVLSKKAGLPILYLEIKRRERGKYSLKFFELADKPNEVPDGYITEKYAQLLEQSITEQPDNWLWSHKRWKVRK